MEDDNRYTAQEAHDALLSITAYMASAGDEAIADDALWRERVKVQSVLTCPWWLPLPLWKPLVSVQQLRLRRALKQIKRYSPT